MLSSTFCVLLQEKWIDYVSNVLVFEELPDAVTRQHYYLVFWCKSELFDFRHCIDAHPTCHSIAEGSGHGEARYVLVLEPNSHRTDLIAQLIPVRVYASIIC